MTNITCFFIKGTVFDLSLKTKIIMKKILFSLFFVSSFSFSQTEKNVGDFTKVTTFDQIDVLLIPATENKIILNGEHSEEVELVNKNGELKIRMPLTKMMSGENVSATVYFKKVEAVEANEGSRIASEAIFEGLAFDIIAKEGAEIKLIVATDRLTTKVSSGATVKISGTTDFADHLVNSGAVLEAEKLVTKQTTITVNAGGEADIHATDLVDVKTRAGGNITIFGKPKEINQKTIAGGTIVEAK